MTEGLFSRVIKPRDSNKSFHWWRVRVGAPPYAPTNVEGMPFTALFTALFSMYAGVYMMEDNRIGCSRGQVKQAPLAC